MPITFPNHDQVAAMLAANGLDSKAAEAISKRVQSEAIAMNNVLVRHRESVLKRAIRILNLVEHVRELTIGNLMAMNSYCSVIIRHSDQCNMDIEASKDSEVVRVSRRGKVTIGKRPIARLGTQVIAPVMNISSAPIEHGGVIDIAEIRRKGDSYSDCDLIGLSKRACDQARGLPAPPTMDDAVGASIVLTAAIKLRSGESTEDRISRGQLTRIQRTYYTDDHYIRRIFDQVLKTDDKEIKLDKLIAFSCFSAFAEAHKESEKHGFW